MDFKTLSRNLISENAYWQVNKAIAKITDNDTAILLADLISKEMYFENKGQMNGDYFFNTVENIEQDTNIKKDKQRLCLSKLEKLGIVETKMMTIPRKRHYKINHEKLFNVLSEANKIYSERKSRPLMSEKNDDCTTENTPTINKNKYNKNKLNENKNNIKGTSNEALTRYKDINEFLNDIRNFKHNENTLEIASMIYDKFKSFGINHYKLNEEQIKNTIRGIGFIDDVCNTWDYVDHIINYYFSLERNYYSIQDLTNVNTLGFIMGKLELLGAERFNIEGKFEIDEAV